MTHGELFQHSLYTIYPIVARAWLSGCIGRVRARAKVSCIGRNDSPDIHEGESHFVLLQFRPKIKSEMTPRGVCPDYAEMIPPGVMKGGHFDLLQFWPNIQAEMTPGRVISA